MPFFAEKEMRDRNLDFLRTKGLRIFTRDWNLISRGSSLQP